MLEEETKEALRKNRFSTASPEDLHMSFLRITLKGKKDTSSRVLKFGFLSSRDYILKKYKSF